MLLSGEQETKLHCSEDKNAATHSNFLEPSCNIRLRFIFFFFFFSPPSKCWCLIVDAGQKKRPFWCSWTNSEINNPLWEWEHKLKAHNAILWPYLRLLCWRNWFKVSLIIANNIQAREIFQGTNRRSSLDGRLGVSFQPRKGFLFCANKTVFPFIINLPFKLNNFLDFFGDPFQMR